MMRKKIFALGIVWCLVFSACAGNGAMGSEGAESESTEDSGPGDALHNPETEAAYVLNEIAVPEASLGELLPEGGEKTILLEALAGEEIYRLLEIYPNAGEGSYEEVNYCVQVLKPPYEEWTTITFDMADYVKQPGSYVQDAYIEADGTIKMLIRGTEKNRKRHWSRPVDLFCRL